METVNIVRTNSKNKDFIDLVSKLNAELKVIDGDDHDFYMQYNGIDKLNNVIIFYQNNIAQCCGTFKEFNDTSVEIKRMYTNKEARGKGFATKILLELEDWAKELGYKNTILETGKRQKDAVGLYKKNGYKITENFEPYIGIDNSVCFIKTL